MRAPAAATAVAQRSSVFRSATETSGEKTEWAKNPVALSKRDRDPAPKGCVGVKGRMKLPKKRRKQGKRRMKKAHSSINKNRIEPSHPKGLSFTNPAFLGNSEAWFDTDGVIDSDGEDDFYNIQDGH